VSKSQIRARIELVFRAVNRLFGFVKVLATALRTMHAAPSQHRRWLVNTHSYCIYSQTLTVGNRFFNLHVGDIE